MADGEHRHKLIDLNADRITELEREVSDLKMRVAELEGTEPKPPPGDLPFDDSDPIFRYVGAEMVELEPSWPARFNSQRARGMKVMLPSGLGWIEVPNHHDYEPPTILDDGRISWSHTGSPWHSQCTFVNDDSRMSRGYLTQGRRYGLSADCVYPRYPEEWVQLMQLYGRVHPNIGGSDGQKDVCAFFHRRGLFGNVYGKTPSQNRGESVVVPGEVSIALDVIGGTSKDHANFYYTTNGEPWRDLYLYRGSVGTGRAVTGDSYFVLRWGPYSKASIGPVIYDNIGIYSL